MAVSVMDSRPLFDAPKKTCQWAPGSILSSETNFYKVDCVLRQGVIGQVVKCSRIMDSKPVLIKMIKNHPNNVGAIHSEVHILEKLRQLDPDRSRLVKWQQVFEDRVFTCLVFEPVETNLLNVMMERHSHPLGLNTIRTIVKQVASALFYLKSLDIIHANLKLENVLLVNQRSEPCRVKVFDFSQAHEVSAARQGQCIQHLRYRSPEIILGIPYNAAVDVWSLGCITAVLYLGVVLYPGKSPYEMLRYMVQTQGQPSDSLLNQGLMTTRFFLKDASSDSWRLKSQEEYSQDEDFPLTENSSQVSSSPQDFLSPRQPGSHNPSDNLHTFKALLKGMIRLDAAERLTPHQVLQHPFINPFPRDACIAKETPAAPWISSCSQESKIEPTKQSLKRKMSQEPKTDPRIKRAFLYPGLSSSA